MIAQKMEYINMIIKIYVIKNALMELSKMKQIICAMKIIMILMKII